MLPAALTVGNPNTDLPSLAGPAASVKVTPDTVPVTAFTNADSPVDFVSVFLATDLSITYLADSFTDTL